MRRTVLVLLLVLLPLRLWAADAMQVRMAAPAVAEMAGDCPMLAAASHDDAAAPGGAASTSDAHCTACQLCAAVAATLPLPASPVVCRTPAPASPPWHVGDADLEREAEPPRS